MKKTITLLAAGLVAGYTLGQLSVFKIWLDGNWQNFVTDVDQDWAYRLNREPQLDHSLTAGDLQPLQDAWLSALLRENFHG